MKRVIPALFTMAALALFWIQSGWTQQQGQPTPPPAPTADEDSDDAMDWMNEDQSPEHQATPGQPESRTARRDQLPATEAGPSDQAHGQEGHGRPSAVLGVSIQPQSTGPGVQVMNVQPDSPAARAGMRNGDQIVRINDREVRSAQDLSRMIGEMKPNTEVTIHYRRDNKDQTAKATLAAPQMVAGQEPPQMPGGPMMGPPMRGGQAWFGVFVQPAQPTQPGQPAPAEQGVRIAMIHPAGPAAKAGLRIGDLIVRIGDQQVTSPEQVRDIVTKHKPNDHVAVVVRREGKDQNIDLTLGNTDQMMRPDQMIGQGFMGPGMQPGMQPGMGMPGAEQGMSMQRMEQTLQQLLQEVQSLRREVAEMRAAQRQGPNTAQGQPGSERR